MDDSTNLFVVTGTPTLDEVKRLYLRHVLEQHNGNKSGAARTLGITRSCIQRLLRRSS